jgi:Zn-dependent protease with chaperone function
MDFFARQDQARRNTKLLVFYFVVAVVLIIASVYFASLLIFQGATTYRHQGELAGFALWNQTFLPPPALVSGYSRQPVQDRTTFQRRERGLILGGRLRFSDPHERKLLNVVEEMSIASGVPTPQVYVMDEEPGINAFAAGHTPNAAAIGVTRGCIATLKRDELQGVIGHEFSHILNGDMRLNCASWNYFGIVCLAIGRILFPQRAQESPHCSDSV